MPLPEAPTCNPEARDLAYPFRLFAPLICALTAVPACAADFAIAPAKVTLTGNFARAQLLVTAADGSDATARAAYASSKAGVVAVSPSGQLVAVGNGEATITATLSGVAHEVLVKVEGVVSEPVVDFSIQVMPILAK